MIVALIYGIISLSFQTSTITIADFKNQQDISNWFVVNDGVMGGYSNGSISLSDDGYGLYQGYVTTRNNGGFSSIRYRFKPKKISKYTHVSLRVRGDGKIYQFRIKNQSNARYSYIQYFETTKEWETITIPLNSFYASFRGYKLNVSNYSGQEIGEIAILIGNKKNEDFALEIERIWLK